jgi:hypothetical protein
MHAKGLSVVAAAVVLGWVAAPAFAQTPGLTKEEAKCQQTAGFEQGKYASKKANCITKCYKDSSSGKVPYSDCQPPYGGDTASCNASANSKGASKINKTCNEPLAKGKDSCPDCYSANANIGANCQNSGTFFTTDQVDFFIDTIFVGPLGCADPATLDKDQNGCVQAMGKGGGKMAMKFSNCYKKCRGSVEKGQATADSCSAPATDANGVGLPGKNATLVGCLAKEISKLRDTYGKKCASQPACWDDFVLTQDMPNNFIGTINGVYGVADPTTYCGSPSAAFIDLGAGLLD